MKQTLKLLACTLVSALAIGSTGSKAAEPTKLVYGNTSQIGLSQAPIVAAKKLGYFKEEGVDVEIMAFNGTGTLLPQMLSGRVDIGFINADTLILSRDPAKEKIPVRMFYNVARSSIWEFAVLADSPYQSLKDLDGQTVGVGALSWGNMPITTAQFKELGVNATFQPVGTGAASYLALTSKRIAALNSFDTEIAPMETQGIKLRRLPQLPGAAGLFSNGFAAPDKVIAEKPEALKSFGRAVAKATVFCETNTAACVKIFWSEYPDMRPSGDEGKVLGDAVTILSARIKRMTAFPAGPREYGKYDPQVWGKFAEALHNGGQLSTKDVDVENCYTNEFVADFSKFDAEAVKAQAAAFKE